MIVVSGCLAGERCRYDGESKPDERIKAMVESGEAITVCPEQLGGLSTPRMPCEIIGGDGFDVLDGKARVMDRDGMDQTQAFINGAKETLKIVLESGTKRVMLKSLSPSCGYKRIYDGTFSRKVQSGLGVTAALLIKNGITVEEI